MIRRIAVAFFLLTLCASCQKFAEGRKLFHDLLVLRGDLAKEFHESSIDIAISGDRLIVKFVNSPLNSSSMTAKQQRADAVAAFVNAHYPHPVAAVSTEFVSKTGPVSSSQVFEGRR